MDTPNDDRTLVSAAGNLNIGVIARFHQELSDAVAASSRVEIQVEDDAEFDLALIQLIESARRTADAAGRQVALASPATGALRAMLERGGFAPEGAVESRQFWFHEDVK